MVPEEKDGSGKKGEMNSERLDRGESSNKDSARMQAHYCGGRCKTREIPISGIRAKL